MYVGCRLIGLHITLPPPPTPQKKKTNNPMKAQTKGEVMQGDRTSVQLFAAS